MKKLHKLIIVTFIVVVLSCNDNGKVVDLSQHPNIQKTYDPSVPITIISNAIIKTNYKDSIYPKDFEAVFMDSTFVKEITERGQSTYSFHTVNIGKIKIESGHIIACDPSFMQHGKPFTDKFPIGNFDVQLSIANIPVQNNRVAFSRILFSSNPVRKWVYATREGEEKVPINDSTLYSFPVDAGLAIYIDQTARDVFNAYDSKDFMKVFVNGMEKEGNFFGYVHNFESHNLATFSTGYGDGSYGSFIGLDKNGEICRLVSDLGILMWWKK
ncbi:MAG: DUF4241 domain-containing protein [Bacteroidota bacterium]